MFKGEKGSQPKKIIICCLVKRHVVGLKSPVRQYIYIRYGILSVLTEIFLISFQFGPLLN